MSAALLAQPRVVIVGAGVSGICMAAMLLREGFTDVAVYEKADDLGGTWRDNTYPGIRCDGPSRFYQFAWDLNPEWSRLFSPGGEIQHYLQDVAARSAITELVRFNAEVTRAAWDGTQWALELRNGDRDRADVLITATGVLRVPKMPSIPGLEEFTGPAFHSSRWDHAARIEGARVGLIGSGSTGVQIASAVGPVAGRLSHFVRTPQWIFPVPNPRYRSAGLKLHRRFPGLGLRIHDWYRAATEQVAAGLLDDGLRRRLIGRAVRAHLATIRDEDLRRRLTPTDEPLCRRLILDGDYYRVVQQPQVEVVSSAIKRVSPAGVVTADGVVHPLDVLVLATGFDPIAFMRPMEVLGRDGRSIDEVWGRAPRAHRTVAMPGFPNFFTLLGPRSPVASASLIQAAESQVGYVQQAVREIAAGSILEPRQEAADAYNVTLDQAVGSTVWATGCDSWYIDGSGMPNAWPLHPREHRKMLEKLNLEEYRVQRASVTPGPARRRVAAAETAKGTDRPKHGDLGVALAADPETLDRQGQFRITSFP